MRWYRRPPRRDIIVSHDRFRPMGAGQNLALYYSIKDNSGMQLGQLQQFFISRVMVILPISEVKRVSTSMGDRPGTTYSLWRLTFTSASSQIKFTR